MDSNKKSNKWIVIAIVLAAIAVVSVCEMFRRVGGNAPAAQLSSTAALQTPGESRIPTQTPSPVLIVTKSHYDKIQIGMSYSDVRGIIGTDGEELVRSGGSEGAYLIVGYRWKNSDESWLLTTFANNRLTDKSKSGLQ